MKLHRLRKDAKLQAYVQSFLWLAASTTALMAMWLLSCIHPFTLYSRFFHTVGICLLGSAAAGASFMGSGWLCIASQIREISDMKMAMIYAGCSAEEICWRQYNVWRFRFFGMARYLKNTQESHVIELLEQGKEPREIFNRSR